MSEAKDISIKTEGEPTETPQGPKEGPPLQFESQLPRLSREGSGEEKGQEEGPEGESGEAQQISEERKHKHKKHKKEKKDKKKKSKKEKKKKRDRKEEEEIEEQIDSSTLQEAERKRDAKMNEKEDKRVEGTVRELKKKMKEEEEKKEEEALMENYTESQKHTYNQIKAKINKPKKNNDGGIDLDQDKAFQEQVEDLRFKMREANQSDRENNKIKKPAMRRLLIANEVYSALKKQNVQQTFLDEKGCEDLADWIDMMPDGTFPNINLVEGVLHCIDGLSIETDHLEQTKMGMVMQIYAEDMAGMPKVKRLAKQIMDKWSRMIYKINQSYDAEGDYDIGYRKLQQKIEKLKMKGDEECVHSQEPKLKKKLSDKDAIKRGRVGIILPDRNAFDFTNRPQKQGEVRMEKKKEAESGKAKLQKQILKLKKEKNRQFTNKNMQTVKIIE